MTVKIKICGIKTIEDAQAAGEARADFLGFNFVPVSKRYIKPEKAKEIIDDLNNYYLCHCEPRAKQSLKICIDRHAPIKSELAMTDRQEIVGVFQNEKIDIINKLIAYLKLDYVQLHGGESLVYVSKIENSKIIKTISLPADFDVEETMKKMKKYKVDYFLLDRKEQGRGESLNPAKVQQLTTIFPIILGGGLTISNVARIVQLTKPQAVDVAGGVEVEGVKNKERIKQFIYNAKL